MTGTWSPLQFDEKEKQLTAEWLREMKKVLTTCRFVELTLSRVRQNYRSNCQKSSSFSPPRSLQPLWCIVFSLEAVPCIVWLLLRLWSNASDGFYVNAGKGNMGRGRKTEAEGVEGEEDKGNEGDCTAGS
jgi:hypothetical protein